MELEMFGYFERDCKFVQKCFIVERTDFFSLCWRTRIVLWL